MYRTTLLSDTTKSNLCAKIAKAERRDKRRTKFFRFGCSEPHSILFKGKKKEKKLCIFKKLPIFAPA